MIRTPPTIAIIDKVIAEIHDREKKGLLKKGWSVNEKNRVAMFFVDFVDRV